MKEYYQNYLLHMLYILRTVFIAQYSREVNYFGKSKQPVLYMGTGRQPF